MTASQLDRLLAFVDRVNVILLIPHGRAGSYFIQSLFDGHEAVISFPSSFSTFGWRSAASADPSRFVDDFCSTHDSFFDSTRSYIGTQDWVSPALLGADQDERIQIDVNRYSALLRTLLARYRERAPLTDRAILAIMHFALAEVLGRSTDSIRYILFHLHGGDTYGPSVDRLLAEAPDLYFIAALRDLRDTWLGFRTLLTRRWGAQDFFHTLLRYLKVNVSLYDDLFRYHGRFRPGHVKLVDLNRLHQLQGAGMQRLADWLDIPFTPALVGSSFLGKQWWGNSADGRPLSGFSIDKARPGWPGRLAPHETAVVVYLSAHIMRVFGQPPDPATVPSRPAAYWTMLFRGPLFNWPRSDSAVARFAERGQCFHAHALAAHLPGHQRPAACLLYNSLYLAIVSWCDLLRKFSVREILRRERLRSAAVATNAFQRDLL